jgi:hypothetical protein
MLSSLPQDPTAISDVWVLTRVHGVATRSPVPAFSRTLMAERGRLAGGSRAYNRRIWSPNLGVFAVSAAGVLCAFPAWWTRYLDSVSAARLAQIPLSLLF